MDFKVISIMNSIFNSKPRNRYYSKRVVPYRAWRQCIDRQNRYISHKMAKMNNAIDAKKKCDLFIKTLSLKIADYLYFLYAFIKCNK